MTPRVWDRVRRFPPELEHLEADEPLGQLACVAGGLWTAVAPRGWPEACRWASTFLPGQWTPKDKGLTWGDGSRYLWFVEPGREKPVLEARSIVQGLGLDCGWSIGSAARTLLKWLGPKERAFSSSLRLIPPGGINYYDCMPGEYEGAMMWDVSSYYFDLWNRLPTLRPYTRATGEILWGYQSAEEAGRRAMLARVVSGHKYLRNALWGCSLGRQRGHVFYFGGARKSHPGSPGPFYTAALLVARSAWELTRLAAEEVSSVLSLVDCVVSTGGEYPSTWSNLGFGVQCKAQGEADIRAPFVYRIGGRQTDFYAPGGCFTEELPRRPAPDRQWYRSWVA